MVSNNNKITKENVMPLFLKACPSYQESWDKFDDKELLYVCLGNLAHHLMNLYKKNKIEEFDAVCKVVEDLHIHGDKFVKEAATIGFLEGIQNVWGNSGIDPENFYPFLLPESKKMVERT